jgi:hypothetical protein
MFDTDSCVLVNIAAAQQNQIAHDAGQQAGRVGIIRMAHKKNPQVLMGRDPMAPSTGSGRRLRDDLIVKQFLLGFGTAF